MVLKLQLVENANVSDLALSWVPFIGAIRPPTPLASNGKDRVWFQDGPHFGFWPLSELWGGSLQQLQWKWARLIVFLLPSNICKPLHTRLLILGSVP